MTLQKIVVLFLMALLPLPAISRAAETDAPTIYVIKQGDTLWGLSERFIKDPYYWPRMWAKNSQITNPHFIYPGQKVRVFPDHLEFVPKEQTAAEGKKASAGKKSEPLQEVAPEKTYSVSGNEGFLLESDLQPAGVITNISHGRAIAGVDDIVYTNIGSNNGVKGGESYAIFRHDTVVRHPVTDQVMGTKIIPLGRLQLTDMETETSRAIITSNYREITANAYLLPPQPAGKREITLKESTRPLSGYIVESFHGTGIIASGDVVYTDLGTNQGVEPGNMLYIVREVVFPEKFYEKSAPRLPQEVLGALVIVEAGNNTSTALIVKSVDTIYKGNKIVSVTR